MKRQKTHDQMGQGDFENSDEDQMMQEDDLDYSFGETDLDLPEKEIREGETRRAK